MRVRHRFTAVARCPVNDSTDEYAVIVWTDRLIPVEAIRKHADDLGKQPIYQEDFTHQLAVLLDAQVETSGKHGEFETVCST